MTDYTWKCYVCGKLFMVGVDRPDDLECEACKIQS